jgi:hypothetical protein
LRESRILTRVCGRVGCFELPLPECRCQAIYCGAECRSAMQRAYRQNPGKRPDCCVAPGTTCSV